MNVHIPKDKVTNVHQVRKTCGFRLTMQRSFFLPVDLPWNSHVGQPQGFGFVEFRSEDDAEYAIKVMNMIKLFGQPLRLNKKATGDIRVSSPPDAPMYRAHSAQAPRYHGVPPSRRSAYKPPPASSARSQAPLGSREPASARHVRSTLQEQKRGTHRYLSLSFSLSLWPCLPILVSVHPQSVRMRLLLTTC